jgi:hypothetical protein
MKERLYAKLKCYKDALRNKPSEETGIITHWQKKMLKENPPKDDKG